MSRSPEGAIRFPDACTLPASVALNGDRASIPCNWQRLERGFEPSQLSKYLAELTEHSRNELLHSSEVIHNNQAEAYEAAQSPG